MGFPCEHCRSLADATHRRNGMPAPQGWDAALVITFVCTACLLGAYRYTDVRACFSPIQEGLRAPSARNATSLATTCNAVSSGPSSRGDPAMQVAMARHEAYEKDISDALGFFCSSALVGACFDEAAQCRSHRDRHYFKNPFMHVRRKHIISRS